MTGAVTASPAFAADALAQARAAMAQASFEKALTIADKALKSTKEPARRGQLDLVRAECFHALRKKGEMRDALAEALWEDPLASFDEDATNPELREALADQRKALAGRLIVSGTFASDAAPQVTLDGAKVGRAPLTVRADVGQHRVTLAWPGGEVQKETVVIRVEADTTLSVLRAGSAVERTEQSKLSPRARGSPEVPPEALAPSEDEEERAPKSRWPWPAIGVGAAFGIGGGICLGVAKGRHDALTGGSGTSMLMLDRDSALLYAEQGRRIEVLGIVLAVAGVVLLAAGVIGLVVDR